MSITDFGAEGVAWVLNLDAEDELGHPGAHTPTASMTARIEALIPRLAGLIRPGDQLIYPGSGEVDPKRLGRAWCPTRWAITQMKGVGVRIPRAPSVEVLRKVNHRRFCHELGQTLPGAGYVQNEAEFTGLIAASTEKSWLVKRPLSYAGRGRRKLRAGELSAADQSWIAASLRDGEGVQVEPLVAIELDCALHGWLAEDGQCTWGSPTVQRVDATGAWQSSVVAIGELSSAEVESLQREGARTALALHSAGYFGPFGIDAFRWRTGSGELRFQPRCEINARYSMGWATGMGTFRPVE